MPEDGVDWFLLGVVWVCAVVFLVATWGLG